MWDLGCPSWCLSLDFKGLTFNKVFGSIGLSKEESYIFVGCLEPTQWDYRQIYF
jgi:hypothetical protein